MNAQVKIHYSAASEIVTGWDVASPKSGPRRGRRGYVVTNNAGDPLAFIETLWPHPRIEELLAQYAVAGTFTARGLMRDLLNAEDYRSDIYDAIVRVYYPEDFANV